MKKAINAILILSFTIALSLQSSAFDPLPAGCKAHCSNITDCQTCMSDCEGYIGSYTDIRTVLDAILRREKVSASTYDPDAVKNLEKCWCSACCEYKYGGDANHPCIYPCPCSIRNETGNATTTTTLDKKQRPDLATSLNEITGSVNYSLCYALNILWIVIPGITALIIMWAGSRYLTSEEDPIKRINARNIVVYALGGLIFSVAACPALDYLILNTNITPFQSSCKCYELMSLKAGVTPTMPYIANITTSSFVQTTHGIPTTMTTLVRNTTTTTKSTTTSTTTTTLGCLGPCEQYKATHVLPAAFDWRNVNGKNYMTGVRDQGSCGSCWAHATLGSMEGTYNVEQCKPAENNIAEQELVSCAGSYPNNRGCNGGLYTSAFMYIKDQKIVEESCFPYKAANVACSRCASPKLWSITSWTNVGNNMNSVKAYLICHGPIAIACTNWANTGFGHAITLTGYDDNSQICQSHYGKAGCWIMKNSWGVFTGTSGGIYHQGGYGYIPYTGSVVSDIVGGYYSPAAPSGIKAP